MNLVEVLTGRKNMNVYLSKNNMIRRKDDI
jgi:hypothetical protein